MAELRQSGSDIVGDQENCEISGNSKAIRLRLIIFLDSEKNNKKSVIIKRIVLFFTLFVFVLTITSIIVGLYSAVRITTTDKPSGKLKI